MLDHTAPRLRGDNLLSRQGATQRSDHAHRLSATNCEFVRGARTWSERPGADFSPKVHEAYGTAAGDPVGKPACRPPRSIAAAAATAIAQEREKREARSSLLIELTNEADDKQEPFARRITLGNPLPGGEERDLILMGVLIIVSLWSGGILCFWTLSLSTDERWSKDAFECEMSALLECNDYI